MTITHTLRSLLLVTALLASACTSATTGESIDDVELASALRSFDGCDALTTHLRGQAAHLVTPYGLRGGTEVAEGAVVDRAGSEAAAEAASAADTSGAAGAESTGGGGTFSTTNVQEAGVDEPDIAKTDGTHVYTVSDGTLRIVDVRGSRPRLTATVELSGGWPRDLLLHDDRLLVLGEATPPVSPRSGSSRRTSPDGIELLPGWNGQTRLWLVDVADPSTATVRSTMTVDGSLLSSRRTGPTVRVVVRTQPGLAGLVAPTGGPATEAHALAVNRARVARADAQAWLPKVAVDGASPRPLVECSAVHTPPSTKDLGVVSVLTLNLQGADLGAQRAQAVLGAADTVYATDDSLYVTTSRWPQVLPVDPLPVPERPLPVDPLPIPEGPLPVEPDAPGSDAPAPTVTTEIHRFGLDDDGATHVASGSVPGQVLNQWALSEHEGHLRIATTEDATGDPAGSSSAVRVLRQHGSRLEQVGHVGDLGRGERIFAVRYAGDIGYVVTFRQIDPLYTLDLSDPTAPRVLGELKIPGYSAYLHPIGDEHLLGVGQDADLDGRVRGVQVSMFDIADLTAPERVDQVEVGEDTSTDVEHDHRALLYWPDRDVVVLPVQRWSRGDAGVLVLHADVDGGLTVRGFVRQPARGDQDAVIQRSMVVDDRLVTVAPSGVMVSDLDSLAAVATVQFPPAAP